MENKVKEKYTYKEILLAIREESLKNQKLLQELSELISIEKNVGKYHFDDKLSCDSEPYKILLVIDTIQKKQSKLKEIFNKITEYRFARATLNKFQMYLVNSENGNNSFELKYTDGLTEDYFGSIEILDNVRFERIIDELKNSKLSKITEKGIHIDDNIFVEIADFIGIVNGKNSIHYASGVDGLKIELTDKGFDDILNTEISSSLLSNEVIDLINNADNNEVDIEFVESKGVPYNYYLFNECDEKIVLKRKSFIKK